MVEDDITGGYDSNNEKFIFTDGCGRISMELAKNIAKEINSKSVAVSSCFQVIF